MRTKIYKTNLAFKILKELKILKNILMQEKIKNPYSQKAKVLNKIYSELRAVAYNLLNNTIINKGLKNKKIHKKSQKGQILDFLQKNPDEIVAGSDFMGGFFNKKPFIGYSASARLSELKKLGLVEYVGRRKGIKTFFKKSRDRNLYKITKKGLNYKLI